LTLPVWTGLELTTSRLRALRMSHCNRLTQDIRDFALSLTSVRFLGTEEKWIGPAKIQRKHRSVLVRAKAWRSIDLPSASFKSRVITVRRGENDSKET
jgi:hypothetical protein